MKSNNALIYLGWTSILLPTVPLTLVKFSWYAPALHVNDRLGWNVSDSDNLNALYSSENVIQHVPHGCHLSRVIGCLYCPLKYLA
jgi:hypothetical protein